MNFDDSTYEEIASYLNNQMDEQAKKAFEERLQNDEDLADFFATYKELDGVYDEQKWNIKINATSSEIKELANQFRTEDVTELSKKIRSIQQKGNTTTSKTKRKTTFYYISSAVAIAALFALFYFSFSQTLSPKEAFDSYNDWSILPAFQTKNDVQSDISKAVTLFNEKEYKKALTIFKSSQQETSTFDPSIQLYIGVCQLELNYNKEALSTFKNIRNSNTLDAHKAFWFIALTHLKLEDSKSAIATLEQLIQNEDNFNYEKAKNLLKRLK